MGASGLLRLTSSPEEYGMPLFSLQVSQYAMTSAQLTWRNNVRSAVRTIYFLLPDMIVPVCLDARARGRLSADGSSSYLLVSVLQ
eukprot:3560343-Pleurochrysis_carterae.AAC.1